VAHAAPATDKTQASSDTPAEAVNRRRIIGLHDTTVPARQTAAWRGKAGAKGLAFAGPVKPPPSGVGISVAPSP
jgi:hypothetical protein